MNNEQQLTTMIKEFSSSYILSCQLSLYLLDLQRNYLNYIHNRDEEMDNLDSGIYQLKKHKSSRKCKCIEDYIWFCYDYLSNKGDDYSEGQEKGKTHKEIESEVRKVIFQDLNDVIINIYDEENLRDLNLETIMSATFLYMVCYSPDNIKINKMNDLIKKICEVTKGKGVAKLRKKFRNKTFCSCFVKDNNTEMDCFAFSGGWDNDKYPNDLIKDSSILLRMKSFIEEAVKKIFGRDLTWCIRKGNMISYEFRCSENKYTRLGRIYKSCKDKRKNCINIHFSCCERKILSYFEDKNDVDLEIYVTFNPCSDCKLAIHQFLKEKKDSKIKVIYDKEKKELLSHKNNCDLYIK